MLRFAKSPLKLTMQAFVVCMLSGGGETGLFASNTPVAIEQLQAAEAWKKRADEIELHGSPAWRAQLLYVTRLAGRNSSVVDSSEFFFAKDGKTNLHSELYASIDALFLPVINDKPDDHALCRFPRRSAWIVENLQIPNELLPKVTCKELDRFLQQQSAQGISLVFASYFINNPASMFGHTFLRIHRGKGPGDGEPNALLDSAVNFAANPTTDNALLYPLMGLTGQFAGTFSLMPYYLKVQEYNNAESRDLWEYPLNISEQQVKNLMLTLWEVGPVKIDYWYIDENCSYILLLVLETVNPGMNLAKSFNVMATPADTLRAVVAQPGLTKPPKYRPSALSTYVQRESYLDDDGVARLKKLIQQNPVVIDDVLAGLNNDGKASVIDAAIDYIDFDEDVVGNKLPEKQKQRRLDLLKARSIVLVPPKPIDKIPFDERPDRGHWSMRVGVSAGVHQIKSEQVRAVDFDWRPTLHDLATPSHGYSRELELKMLEFKFRQNMTNGKSNLRLHSATPFEVLSIPPLGRVKKPLSWTFGLSSVPVGVDDAEGSCHQHSMGGGVGASTRVNSARFFALGLVRLAVNCRGYRSLNAAGGGMLGLLSDLSETSKVSLKSVWLRPHFFHDASRNGVWERSAELKVTKLLNNAHEVSLFAHFTNEIKGGGGLSYGYYF